MMPERNSTSWSYCHGNPLECIVHHHDESSVIINSNKDIKTARHYFHNSLDEDSYLAMQEYLMSQLTLEEMQTIAYYADSGFKKIHHLTAQNEEHPHILNLENALKKCKSQPLTLYRGTLEKQDYAVGNVIELATYTSTTSNPHKAVQFTNRDTPTIMMFETKRGIPISIVHNEMEFLLPRQSQYLVNDILYTDLCLVYSNTDYIRRYENAVIYHLTDI